MAANLYSVGLFVNNLKEMVAFYRDVVGMDIEWDGRDPHVVCRQGSVRFMLYPRRNFEETLRRRFSYPLGLNGSFQLGLDLPTFAEVDREYDRMLAAGARPVSSPETYGWETGSLRSCYVSDPEGNLIELSSAGDGNR